MNLPAGDADERPCIRVNPNGPYRVQGAVAIRNAQGEPIEAPAAYSLCRCGGSANKPFCDATHRRIEFDGEETADRGPIERRRIAYRGAGITIFDDRSVCSHAGHCTDNLAAVFKLEGEPWIDARSADVEAIVAVIKRCPSGALSYALGDSEETIEGDAAPAITATRNGPYAVVGRLELRSPDGSTYQVRARYTLCRCGGSKNKPFCDGTHWQIGFKAG